MRRSAIRSIKGARECKEKVAISLCASVPSVVDGKPDYFTASTVFLTPWPTSFAPFFVPFTVSFVATLVAWPVLPATFSVPFVVSLAAAFVACGGLVGSLVGVLHRIFSRDLGGMAGRFLRPYPWPWPVYFASFFYVGRSVLRQCDRKRTE